MFSILYRYSLCFIHWKLFIIGWPGKELMLNLFPSVSTCTSTDPARPAPLAVSDWVGGNTNTVIVRWKYSLGCFKNILILMLNIRPLTMFPTLKFVRPINIFKIHNHL